MKLCDHFLKKTRFCRGTENGTESMNTGYRGDNVGDADVSRKLFWQFKCVFLKTLYGALRGRRCRTYVLFL